MKRSQLLPWLRSWSRRSYVLHGILIAQMIMLPCSTSNGEWVPVDEDGDGFFETGYDDGQPDPNTPPPTPDPDPEPPLPPQADADGDGLNNADESAAGSDPYNPDSDYDGLTDADETGLTGSDPTSTDTDQDGISDYNEFYGNTAVDEDVVGPGETPYDHDGDGLNDPVDPDPLSPTNDPDSDGDYVPDSQDTDPANPNEWNDANNNGTNDDAEIPNNDSDGDGISNDTDSHPSDPYLSNDWNYNGGNDQNEDWDGDGVSNLQDSNPNSNCQWCDWNGNGVNDDSEAGTSDSDGDGVADNADSHSYNSSLWEDWNNNGANDSGESQDSDADSHFDYQDSDPQNSSLWEDWNRNGTNDSQETTTPPPADRDSDGVTDDSDSDPDNSSLWGDWNRNGTNDGDETPPPDSDGDSYPDDSDSDPSDINLWEDGNRNGYNDSTEDQFIDNDQDGRVNAFDSHPNDANLWNDQNGNAQNDEDEIIIVDSDGDGYADNLDTHPDDPQRWNDHNNNGSNDELDVPLDIDSDGLPDAQDPSPSDSDNDGLTNTEEALNGSNPNNADTDGDGSPDGIEQLAGTNPGNVDTDGDGLTDNEELQAYFTDPLVVNPNSFSEISDPSASPFDGNDDSPSSGSPAGGNTSSEAPPAYNPTVNNPPPEDPQAPPQITVFIQENENSADGIDSAYPAQSGETTSFPSLSADKIKKSDLSKTIFIRNDGEADLALGEIIKSGPNSSEFSISLFNPGSPSPTATLSLVSNAVASFSVTFSAKPALAKISQTAALRISSNDPLKSNFDITLASIVPAGIWQSEGAYFSADLRDSDGDGIPDLVADMYKPLKVTAIGDLDGDGVNNLAQYRQGRDLLNNVVTSDIDMDGLSNQIEETWAKAYPGLISKYRFEDAYVDPDQDGLLTIEELNCTWGDATVKDPAAVATNPFLNSTGPNNAGTPALKSAISYKLTSRAAPSNTTDPKLKWAWRPASGSYAEWMNDGLLRLAYRDSATNGIYPADFFTRRYLSPAPATLGEVSGFDHLPLGYLRWLKSRAPTEWANPSNPNTAPLEDSLPTSTSGTSPEKTNLSNLIMTGDHLDGDTMPNVWEARHQLNWRIPTDASLVEALASIDSRTDALKLTAAETLSLQRTGNTKATFKTLIRQKLNASFNSGETMQNPERTPSSRFIRIANEYALVRKVPIALGAQPPPSASPIIQNKWAGNRDTWLTEFTEYHTWPYLAEIDPDHDGLVNADEYFLDLNPNLADFTGTADVRDTDGDGFTNAQELAAGTDSKKASSKPKLVVKVISGANQSGLPHASIPFPVVIQSVYQGDKGGFCPAPGAVVDVAAPNNYTLLAKLEGIQTAATIPKENWTPQTLQLTTDNQGKVQFSIKLPYLKGKLTLGITASKAALKSASVTATISIVPSTNDTDGDGMPDAWETKVATTQPLIMPAHGLNKSSALDAEESPLHVSYHRDTHLSKIPAATRAPLENMRQGGRLKPASMLTIAQKTILTKIDPDNDGLSNLDEYLLRDTGLTHPKIGSKPHITVQPRNQGALTGTNPKLFVSAVTGDGLNPNLQYQWYIGAAGTITSPLTTPEGTTSEISVPAPTVVGAKTSSYWVRVRNSTLTTLTTDSTAAALTTLPALAIIKQPQENTLLTSVRTVTLAVIAEGGSAAYPLSYQWYAGEKGDISKPILAATKAAYSTSQVQDGLYQYWVMVTSPVGLELASETAKVIVQVGPMIIIQPKSQTKQPGSSVWLKVSAVGTEPMTYQWQRITYAPVGAQAPIYTDIPNANRSDYSASRLGNDGYGFYRYIVLVKDANNITTRTATATVTITSQRTLPIIEIEPKDNYDVLDDGRIQFTVLASGELDGYPATTLKYQWYVGPPQDNSKPISNATSNTYTIVADASGLSQVWVKVSNLTGTANSEAVPLKEIAASESTRKPQPTEPNPPFHLRWNNPYISATYQYSLDRLPRTGDPTPKDTVLVQASITHYPNGNDFQNLAGVNVFKENGTVIPASILSVITKGFFPLQKAFTQESFTNQNICDGIIPRVGAMGRAPLSDEFGGLISFFTSEYFNNNKPRDNLGFLETHYHRLDLTRPQIMAMPADLANRAQSLLAADDYPIQLPQGTQQTFIITKTKRKWKNTPLPTEILEVECKGSFQMKIKPGQSMSQDVLPDALIKEMSKPPLDKESFDLFYNLLPIEVTAHKRGTIDAPGAAIARPGGSEIYEVVTLENADYDETNWQPTSMSDGAQEDKQDGKTDTVSKDKDDDFVKLRFSCPLTNVAGSSEIVFDQAGTGERMQDADIRFYNSAGERVQRSALKIDDLKSPSGPLAPAFAGGLDLFVEIGDLGKTTTAQGSAESTTRKHADLIWKITTGGTTIEQKVRIYRGGFWRNDRTDNSGTIALYDGKGRKPDGTIDYGQIVKGPYQIKTGQEGFTDETTPNKGPTPMGWYGLWDRNPNDGNAGMRTTWDGSSRPQTNHHRDADGDFLGYVQQGSYCQWAQAGNHNIEGKGAYGYDNGNESDPYQGMPASIHFKFELSPIGSFTTRTFLQIHPDGFCDGTAGCVGIQAYDDCTKVLYLVRHYFQTRLLVD